MPKAKTKSPVSTCTVCSHPEVLTINLALARGAAVPLIKGKFPTLSVWALYRHFHRHISGPVLDRLRVKSLAGIVGKNINLAELTASENQAILSQIVALKASLLAGVQAAELANAPMVMSSLVGRVTDLLALEARILGQVMTGSVTTVHNYIQSDNFIAVRSALIAAIRPFPDAAKAVARALLALEAPKDIVDVESTQISGTEQSVTPTLPRGAAGGETQPLLTPAACSVPAPVIHLETATDSITTEKK